MKLIKNLRILSKLSFIFAIIVILAKLFLEMNFQNMMLGAFPPLVSISLIIDLVFNVFMFVGAGFLFEALAKILENQNNTKE